MQVNLPTPTVALAIGAHPDDIEFGCGGTLAKWAAAGCRIHHLVCTDGSRGSWDPKEDTSQLVITRQAEQRAAAATLGGDPSEVVFLGWPDGELEAGLRQRYQVAYWIRKFQPEVVLGHDPWKRWRLHPDHRNAGFLLTDGVVAARDPHFFPELAFPPHRPKTMLLFESDEIDHLEDVSESFEVKYNALLAHSSQLRSTMGVGATTREQSEKERTEFRNRLLSRLSDTGSRAGLALAEGFKVIDRL